MGLLVEAKRLNFVLTAPWLTEFLQAAREQKEFVNFWVDQAFAALCADERAGALVLGLTYPEKRKAVLTLAAALRAEWLASDEGKAHGQ